MAFRTAHPVHLLWALFAAGCGGGLPLLHPAQTLGRGEARIAGGFSANVAAGALADALRSASNEARTGPGGSGPPRADQTYAKGALVAASVAPGLAPFVGARVGVGNRVEGGLAYTGRAVRADARRSFDLSRRWSLSLGVGGTAALSGRQMGVVLPDVDLDQLHGWGADVPLLIGYSSDGDLYRFWLGARGGWEHVDASQVQSAPSALPSVSLSASRLWVGGLLGLAVGFRHVQVAVEIDMAYANISGEYAGTDARAGGLILTPASALLWLF